MSSRPEPTADRIVWIDGEMTGLTPNSDMLLEIAVVVTDGQLRVLGEFSEVIHQRLEQVVARMDAYVLRMHSVSGLLEEIQQTTPDSCGPKVEQRVIEFLAEHGALGSTVAGSSIHFDRAFLDVWMRGLNRTALHYRNLDVSTVKEIARHHAPEVFATAPAKLLEHRALADIHESIAELRHYINAGLFTPTGWTAALAPEANTGQ